MAEIAAIDDLFHIFVSFRVELDMVPEDLFLFFELMPQTVIAKTVFENRIILEKGGNMLQIARCKDSFKFLIVLFLIQVPDAVEQTENIADRLRQPVADCRYNRRTAMIVELFFQNAAAVACGQRLQMEKFVFSLFELLFQKAPPISFVANFNRQGSKESRRFVSVMNGKKR